MEHAGFIDLDELVLLCRHPQTRRHAEEATRCYRAGLYRSCVVATWLAVAYDFIQKITALHLEGDHAVRHLFERIERAQNNHDIAESLRIEKELLDRAVEYDLISPVEKTFLARLQEDRHLCAHPAMQSLDEPFQATAELARSHLRNAVVYFLQNPPIQGKAALTRILANIDSIGFPRTVEGAIQYFKSGRLPLARLSLVRNLAIALTKSLLHDPEDSDRKTRQFAGLGAILSIFSEPGTAGIQECLPRAASSVADADLSRLFAYVRFVPGSWDLLDHAAQSHMRTFLETGEARIIMPCVLHARHIEPLGELAKGRIQGIAPQEILQYEDLQELPESIEAVVDWFAESPSFESTKVRGRHIIRLKDYLTSEHLIKIINAYRENNQIPGCFQAPGFLKSLISAAEGRKQGIQESCRQLYDSTLDEEIDKVLLSEFPEFEKKQHATVDD